MKPFGVITLTTDFGIVDPYVAMMKGVILTINPDVKIIDISHQIRVGSIYQGAAYIKETFTYFPKGTVHVCVVDPRVGSERRMLGVEADGHFFIGPDNGIFWPVIKEFESAEIFSLDNRDYFLPSVSHTFHGREIFAPVAAQISKGQALENMGKKIDDPVVLELPQPYVEGEFLYGQIVRIDNFGNLISNIGSKDMEGFLGGSVPFVEAGKLKIENLNRIYDEVDEGKPMILINSSDKLEIAVNLGRAFEYLGLDRRDILGAVIKVGRIG